VQVGSWRLTARQVQLAIVAAGIVAGLLNVLVATHDPHPDARINLLVYAPIEILVGWTFLFVGLVAGRRRPDNRVGLLMSIFGLTWFGFLLQWIRVPLVFFIAKLNKEDLIVLKELLEAGKLTSVIDRTYALRDAPEAIRYLEQGHARGKVVITV